MNRRQRKRMMRSKLSDRRDTIKSSSSFDNENKTQRINTVRLVGRMNSWGSHWQAQTMIFQSYCQGTYYSSTQRTRVTTSQHFRRQPGRANQPMTSSLLTASSIRCGTRTSPMVSLSIQVYQVDQFPCHTSEKEIRLALIQNQIK